MKKWMYIFTLFALVQCRDAYNVTPATNGDGVLVIEGVLNANGKTIINLSRTTRLSDKRIAPEIGAVLFIEAENGTVHPMSESGAGIYESESLVLDAATKYRLNINTPNNRQYATDYKNYVVSPPVDSLSWQQEDGGVSIFAHAHDISNSTRFYKLDYEETWEFHSDYRVSLKFVEVPPDADGNKFTLQYIRTDQLTDPGLFYCYNNRISSNINIVSTESLGTNELFYRVRHITPAAIELSVLYSINLKQYALSKEGYEFFVKMKKNTESLGSIFDAQPSEIAGNVKCITNPSELTIGYVEFSTIETKRLFINNEQLDDWGYELGCKAFFEPNSSFSGYPYPNDHRLFNHIAERDLIPTTPAETGPGGGVIKFFVATRMCADCTMRGTNVKPDFWP
jgi:hypothetical protein